MRLVTNTSHLIFLTKVDSLGLLRSCFTQVLAPPAVLAEAGLELPGFIERRELSEVGAAFVRGAVGVLHQGELEALVLAREQGIDLVAVDDKAARDRASDMGLRPIGTVGLLRRKWKKMGSDTNGTNLRGRSYINQLVVSTTVLVKGS